MRSPALIPGGRRVAGEPRSGEPAVDAQGGGGATAGGGAAKKQRGDGAAQGDQGHARVVTNAAGGGAHAGAGAHPSIKRWKKISHCIIDIHVMIPLTSNLYKN